MTPVKVVERDGKYVLQTMFAELWNMYAMWCRERAGKMKKKWSRRN